VHQDHEVPNPSAIYLSSGKGLFPLFFYAKVSFVDALFLNSKFIVTFWIFNRNLSIFDTALEICFKFRKFKVEP